MNYVCIRGVLSSPADQDFGAPNGFFSFQWGFGHVKFDLAVYSIFYVSSTSRISITTSGEGRTPHQHVKTQCNNKKKYAHRNLYQLGVTLCSYVSVCEWSGATFTLCLCVILMSGFYSRWRGNEGLYLADYVYYLLTFGGRVIISVKLLLKC